MTPSAGRGARMLPFPATTWVALVTVVVSIAAFVHPPLSDAMVRGAASVHAGEWWRLATPILVQPAGWGQLAFNLLGIAVVGAAFEQRRPLGRWLLTYLTAGVGSVLALTLLRPEDHGGGASDCVAGLIGALAVVRVVDGSAFGGRRGVLDTAALAYSAFFCAYLAGLALGGVWPAIVAGDIAVALALTAAHRLGSARTARGLLVLVGIAGVAMTLVLDGHGIGLLTGVVLAGIAERSASRRRRAGAIE